MRSRYSITVPGAISTGAAANTWNRRNGGVVGSRFRAFEKKENTAASGAGTVVSRRNSCTLKPALK